MKFLLVLLFVVSGFQLCSAQSITIQPDSLEAYISFEAPSEFGFLLEYFPPFLIQHGIELKSFIRSKTFNEIRRKYGDLKAVDAIFIHAMKISNDNTAVSLLLSTLACFDHRIVGLKVPIFALFFPLSDESEEEFNRRTKNLPRKLYTDTPKVPSGDRDKLQHFFGGAFIAYAFESRQPAEGVSELVERGEDAFIVDGVLDERDKRASRHGEEFGLALLKNNNRLPSEFFVQETAGVSDTTGGIGSEISIERDSTKNSGERK